MRTYKNVKNGLFAYGQLIQIVSNFIVVISMMILMFNILSVSLNSYPFVMILAADNTNAARFYPVKADNTLFHGYLLHILSVIQCLLGIGLGLSMKVIKKKKDVEMCSKLKFVITISGISFIIIQLLIFLIGVFFINNTILGLE